MNWKKQIQSYDERRDILIPGDEKSTLEFCIQQFIEIGRQAIEQHNYFAVALSGGSTPKSIYKGLSSEKYKNQLDWSKVLLFWSDERSVPPNDPESNFHMAMEAGFKNLPLKKENIFRMKAEDDIEEHAKEYERTIREKIPSKIFDLVMLGMGEDGHTASLFPKTHALHAPASRLVVANFVTQKNTWRMSLTFDCINQAKHIAIYVIGKNKTEMVKRIFNSAYDPDLLPIQKIGIPQNHALWILDQDAAQELFN
jgi:6-phosphogluconolactonase